MAACPISTLQATGPVTFPRTVCDLVRIAYPTNEDFDMNRTDERVWVTVGGKIKYMHPTKLFRGLEEKRGVKPFDVFNVGDTLERQVLVYVREFEPAKHYFATRRAADLKARITPHTGEKPTVYDPAMPCVNIVIDNGRSLLRFCDDKEVVYCLAYTVSDGNGCKDVLQVERMGLEVRVV